MAKSRFEYVRNFEIPDPLIPETFIVVRIDGRGFHKFSDAHNFEKPNDVPALDLMNRAARAVMDDLVDVVMAFGESDDFLIRKKSNLYNRRRSKINSAICSIFTSAYVFYWNTYLPDRPLKYPPTFDSRVVLYPGAKEVRDYFSWRQADTHINNLYNTCFWCLVKSGLTTNETNKALQGTDSKDKNELLFSRFGINYNKLPEMFRKGSVLVRQERVAAVDAATTPTPTPSSSSTSYSTRTINRASPSEAVSSGAQDNGTSGTEGHSRQQELDTDLKEPTDVEPAQCPSQAAPSPKREDGPASTSQVQQDAEGRPIKLRQRKEKKRRPYEGLTGDVVVLHLDIIGEQFWLERPWLLA